MRWLASKLNEYCSCGNTATPSPCGAARNCPESGEFADLGDTSSLAVSIRRGIPDAACGAACSPTAFSRGHRKRPASAVRHAGECMLQEVFSDDPYGNRFVPVEAESPTDRIRRMRPWDHSLQAGLHIGGLVFFRPKLRIVTFFPCFDSPKLNFFLMQNAAKCFNADLRDDLFGNKILPQFFQRPSFEWTAQKVRRTLGRFSDKCLVILGKFIRPARSRLRFQRFKAAFVKVLDNRPNMMFGIMDQLGNRRYFVPLIRGQHHLSTTDLNPTGTAAENPLNVLALADTEVSGVQTHKKSLSMLDNIEFSLRVCLYNTHLCIAQVLNLEKVKIIF